MIKMIGIPHTITKKLIFTGKDIDATEIFEDSGINIISIKDVTNLNTSYLKSTTDYTFSGSTLTFVKDYQDKELCICYYIFA